MPCTTQTAAAGSNVIVVVFPTAFNGADEVATCLLRVRHARVLRRDGWEDGLLYSGRRAILCCLVGDEEERGALSEDSEASGGAPPGGAAPAWGRWMHVAFGGDELRDRRLTTSDVLHIVEFGGTKGANVSPTKEEQHLLEGMGELRLLHASTLPASDCIPGLMQSCDSGGSVLWLETKTDVATSGRDRDANNSRICPLYLMLDFPGRGAESDKAGKVFTGTYVGPVLLPSWNGPNRLETPATCMTRTCSATVVMLDDGCACRQWDSAASGWLAACRRGVEAAAFILSNFVVTEPEHATERKGRDGGARDRGPSGEAPLAFIIDVFVIVDEETQWDASASENGAISRAAIHQHPTNVGDGCWSEMRVTDKVRIVRSSAGFIADRQVRPSSGPLEYCPRTLLPAKPARLGYAVLKASDERERQSMAIREEEDADALSAVIATDCLLRQWDSMRVALAWVPGEAVSAFVPSEGRQVAQAVLVGLLQALVHLVAHRPMPDRPTNQNHRCCSSDWCARWLQLFARVPEPLPQEEAGTIPSQRSRLVVRLLFGLVARDCRTIEVANALCRLPPPTTSHEVGTRRRRSAGGDADDQDEAYRDHRPPSSTTFSCGDDFVKDDEDAMVLPGTGLFHHFRTVLLEMLSGL